jgi:hypothetical protein
LTGTEPRVDSARIRQRENEQAIEELADLQEDNTGSNNATDASGEPTNVGSCRKP